MSKHKPYNEIVYNKGLLIDAFGYYVFEGVLKLNAKYTARQLIDLLADYDLGSPTLQAVKALPNTLKVSLLSTLIHSGELIHLNYSILRKSRQVYHIIRHNTIGVPSTTTVKLYDFLFNIITRLVELELCTNDVYTTDTKTIIDHICKENNTTLKGNRITVHSTTGSGALGNVSYAFNVVDVVTFLRNTSSSHKKFNNDLYLINGSDSWTFLKDIGVELPVLRISNLI